MAQSPRDGRPVPGPFLVAWEQYLGLHYKFGGRTRAGVDCWGLVRLIYEERLGIVLPKFGEFYSRDLARTSEQLIGAAAMPPWGPIALGDEHAFDVVLMLSLFRGAAHPLHVGVVTKPAHCIHVDENIESVHVPFRDARGVRTHWSLHRRVVGIYRHEGTT